MKKIEKYPKLINKSTNPSDVQFIYDCGDLWLREDVNRWDDYDFCLDNDIIPFITKLNGERIKKFKWRMNYTLPYSSEIEGLKKGQSYKITEDHHHYLVPLEYDYKDKNEFGFMISEEMLNEDIKNIIVLINHLDGVKKLYFGLGGFRGGFLSDSTEDDEFVQQILKNPSWPDESMIYLRDGDSKEDLEDLKLIKTSISPEIKIEFNHLEDEEKKILIKEGIIK